jgi:hypothetical protein
MREIQAEIGKTSDNVNMWPECNVCNIMHTFRPLRNMLNKKFSFQSLKKANKTKNQTCNVFQKHGLDIILQPS